MKRSLLIAALSLILGFGISAQEKSQYRVYGVAFYNLENLFDTINSNDSYDLEYSPSGAKQWNTHKYKSKIHNLAYAISQMTSKTTPKGPAIIGVSEIENESVLIDLVNDPQIRAWNLQIADYHNSPDRRGVDVGLLYNPRFFRLESVTNHRLKIDSYESFRTRDQMCVTGMLGNRRVSVIVNHWPSRLGGQEQSSYLREAAADLSKHIADSIWAVDPDRGIFIMGDLNDDPDDRSVAKNVGAVKHPKDAKPHGFYNPFWSILRDKGVGTLAYNGNWNLFDQILISGNLLEENSTALDLQYFKTQVHNHTFLIDPNGKRQGYPLRTFASGAWLDGYSDHFPTEVFLKQAVPAKKQ
ncbi:MAG: endonuclease/exonuclease/phosphatase family protein [Bacteroides sp.]|nr:endonuclease/exonuclease/phosphatase family protein [Bacteroides sp.]MCM1379661.1 endonuclease/exonuclease/phosphatase family protein [Bacteroides sp.]MCM1445957.1 endonuclease/exonuclease/phosphatase family protein [Prevotella sp.]